jgi:excisionase family DNA binding protein
MKALTDFTESGSVSSTVKLAFRLKEAADLLAVSASFLRLEIARGHLHPTRLGGRRLVITRDELRRYLTRGQEGQHDA